MQNKLLQSINTEISRCVNQLLLKEPFYAHILSGTTRMISSKIPTAAVGLHDGKILLMINEEFFLKNLRTSSERVAVLKHEILHLVFKHLFRELKNKDHELMNLAADIVVNQYIGSWNLPDTAVTLSTFPELQLEPGQTLEYYYKSLEKFKNQIEDEDNQNSLDPDSQDELSDESASKSAFRGLYGTQRHSDHSAWIDEKEAEFLAGLMGQIDKSVINAADRLDSKSYGSLPLEVSRAIADMREQRTPKLDWKRQLRLYASSKGRSYVTHTMKRVSKRYGTRPGIRIRRKNRIAVVIDTSGSINGYTLELFMAEIEGIFRTGAEIVIIESDAAVHKVYKYRRGIKLSFIGGGGTSFDPAFEYINTGKSGSFDLCVYLTDGCAREPAIKPRCSLMWVLEPNGSNSVLKWGKVIQIKL